LELLDTENVGLKSIVNRRGFLLELFPNMDGMYPYPLEEIPGVTVTCGSPFEGAIKYVVESTDLKRINSIRWAKAFLFEAKHRPAEFDPDNIPVEGFIMSGSMERDNERNGYSVTFLNVPRGAYYVLINW
jgi:hypothetical protein